MASPQSNAVLALSTSLLVLMFTGCGGGGDPGLISRDDAAGLLELLDEAQQRFDDGSCDELESTLTELDRAGDRIPDAEVDQPLRTTLNTEIQELTEMAAKCRPSEDEVAPEPVPTPAPEPTIVPETTAPAPVEPTTTEETEPPEEEKPPEEKPTKEKPPKPPTKEKPPKEKPPKPPPRDPCANDSPRC